MLAINYPSNLIKFQTTYLQYLNIPDAIKKEFKDIIQKDPFLYEEYDLDKILLASIEELFQIMDKLKYLYLSSADKLRLKEIINYDKEKSKKYQPEIKSFMENNLEIHTCYFCNIDFINAFNDIGDYHDTVDFIKRAREDDLFKIEGISRAIAKQIIARRVNLFTLRKIRNFETIIENLKKFNLKKRYSHFTLDHLLDKATYPLAALSLYNFVPSCYACNIKFKRRNALVNNRTISNLSPTSKVFSLAHDIKFKLYFYNGKNPSLINSKKDFVLDIEYPEGKGYKDYIDIFKLKGRYIFHKDEVIKLVTDKEKYSQSKIDEMASILGMPSNEIYKDIFGKELFDDTLKNKSLSKFKRDIATNIGIDGII